MCPFLHSRLRAVWWGTLRRSAGLNSGPSTGASHHTLWHIGGGADQVPEALHATSAEPNRRWPCWQKKRTESPNWWADPTVNP